MTKLIKKIVFVILLILISLSLFNTKVFSIDAKDWQSPETLRQYMHANSKEFLDVSAQKIIGKAFKQSSPNLGADFYWSSCIDPHNLSPANRIPRIINMIDIDINGSTTVYQAKKIKGNKIPVGIRQKYSLTTDKEKEYAQRLAYTIYANKNHKPKLGDPYVMAIASLWQQLGRQAGIKKVLYDNARYEGNKVGNQDPTNYTSSTGPYGNNANNYVNGIDEDDQGLQKLKKKSTVVPTTQIQTVKVKKSNKTVTEHYLIAGPFNATFAGGDVTVDYFRIRNGASYTDKTSYDILNSPNGSRTSIQSGKDFYIKTKVSFSQIENRKVILKLRQKDATVISARLLVIAREDKSISQNLALVAASKKKVQSTAKWVITPGGTENKLTITKYGEDEDADGENKKIGGITFNIYKDGQYYTQVTTEEGKSVELTDVPEGYYYGYEIASTNADYCSIAQSNDDRTTNTVYMANGSEEELEMVASNKKYTNLRILKYIENTYNTNKATHTNAKTGEKYSPINGVGFKIQYYNGDRQVPVYNSDGTPQMTTSMDMNGNVIQTQNYQDAPAYQWISSYTFGTPSSIQYTDNENEAMIFYTGTEYGTFAGTTGTENGEIILRCLPEGSYKAKEVSIPDGEPYEFDPSWADHMKELTTTTLMNDGNYNSVFNTFNCSNPWYVRISGYVFTPEKEDGKAERSVLGRDPSEYKSATDRVVNNARVTLMKKNEQGNYEKYEIINDSSQVTGTIYSGYDKENNNQYIGDGGYEFKIRMNGSENFIEEFAVKIEYDALDFMALNPTYNDDQTIVTMQARYNNKESITLIDGATSKLKENEDARADYEALKEVTGTQDAQLEQSNLIYEDSSKNTTLNYKFSKEQTQNIEGNEKTGQSSSTPIDYSTGFSEEEGLNKTLRINSTEIINTIDAMYYLNGQQSNYNYQNYDIRSQTNNALARVIELNLGLIQRESPELQVSNSIVGVNADINDFTNMYKAVRSRKKSEEGINIGVTYVNEGQLNTWSAYPSDVKTITGDTENSKELKVFVTYRIDMINLSESLYSTVNELAVYFDPNYELQAIGTSMNDQNKANNNLQYSEQSDYRGETEGLTIDGKGYQKRFINTKDLKINNHDPANSDDNASNTQSIYATYRVNREELKQMLSNNYTPIYKNIAEINSYTTYSDAEFTKLYNGVDKNSAPGNTQKTITLSGSDSSGKHKELLTQFDNDTGVAEEFTIKLKDEGNRTVTGKVFLDPTSDQLMTGQERTSNGKYEEGQDKKLKNVEVEILEVELNDGKVTYNEQGQPTTKENGIQQLTNTEDGNYIFNTQTNENGDYELKGFIPGNYIIKYTYGNNVQYDDININAVDYKSSVISQENKNEKYKDDKTRYDYTSNDGQHLKWYLTDNPKYTDKDNEDTTNYDRYTEALDNYVTRKNIDYEKINFNTTKSDYHIEKKMDSYTPQFAVSIELNTLSDKNEFLPEGYNIGNMDFGIVERPKQDMTITKRVSNIKIMLPNGQVLLDGDPRKDQKMSGLKYIAPSGVNDKGTVNVELDSELIHGSTLELTYEIIVNNNSEIDYSAEEYYYYGVEELSETERLANLVRIKPEVYDYVDNNLTFDHDKNEQWKTVEQSKFSSTEENKLLVSSEAINTIKLKNTIVYYENMNKIDPGNNEKIYLNLSRVLSNSDDDALTYDNDIEIVEGEKNEISRRITKTIQVGKFMGHGGGIGRSSETTTITPPTGEDKDYTIYIVAGLVSLLILASGIIIIKKKVLK